VFLSLLRIGKNQEVFAKAVLILTWPMPCRTFPGISCMKQYKISFLVKGILRSTENGTRIKAFAR